MALSENSAWTHLEPANMLVEEAARYLGIGRQTAYDLAARGELPGALRLGGRWVVSRKALEEWLEGRAGY